MINTIIENMWNNPLWQLRQKNLPSKKITPVLKKDINKTNENLIAKYREYKSENRDVISRCLLTDNSKIAFWTEQFKLNTPQCVYTSFLIPKDNDFSCNIADKNRLVIRDNNVGLKFFRLVSLTDKIDTLKDSGLLFPNGFTENHEIYVTPYSGLYCFGNEQISYFILIESSSNDIGQWHIRKNDDYEISDPKGLCKFRISTKNEIISLEDIENNSKISFCMNDLT